MDTGLQVFLRPKVQGVRVRTNASKGPRTGWRFRSPMIAWDDNQRCGMRFEEGSVDVRRVPSSDLFPHSKTFSFGSGRMKLPSLIIACTKSYGSFKILFSLRYIQLVYSYSKNEYS